MASYDRYAKRIEKLNVRITEGTPDINLRFDEEKMSNPTKHMDYIFAMLIENKISVELDSTKYKSITLKSLVLTIQ